MNIDKVMSDLFHMMSRGLSYDAAADLVCEQHGIGNAERTELYMAYELRTKTDDDIDHAQETTEHALLNGCTGITREELQATLRELAAERDRRIAAVKAVQEDLRRTRLRNEQLAKLGAPR